MIKQDFTPSKILNYITSNNDIKMQEFAKNINNLNLEVGQLKFLLLTSIEFMKYDYSIYFLDYDNLNELFDNKKNIYVYELLAKHLLNNEKNKLVPFIIKLFGNLITLVLFNCKEPLTDKLSGNLSNS